MAQDLNLHFDVMAAVPVCGDLQSQPFKLYTVIFAHRSFKLFAQHIVQVVPEPAEGMPLSRQATKADPGSRGGWVNSAWSPSLPRGYTPVNTSLADTG